MRSPFTQEDIDYAAPFLGPIIHGKANAGWVVEQILNFAWESLHNRGVVGYDFPRSLSDKPVGYEVAIVTLPKEPE